MPEAIHGKGAYIHTWVKISVIEQKNLFIPQKTALKN